VDVSYCTCVAWYGADGTYIYAKQRPSVIATLYLLVISPCHLQSNVLSLVYSGVTSKTGKS